MSTTEISAVRMSTAKLTLRQVRYENKVFWRNPPAAFFTVVFPLLFLVLFNLLFGHETIRLYPGHPKVSTSTFYVPAIAAFSVISASFTNLAMSITFAREQGVLKRKRGTPLPPLAYLGGKILHSALIALLLVVVIAVFGKAFYSVSIPTHTMAAFLLALIVGAFAFCAMGLAITPFIPNSDAAPAIVNAIILPLLFISDIFINTNQAPNWLNQVAKVFPVWHFSEAMQRAFNPFEKGLGFDAKDVIIVVIWGLGSLLVAIRFFRWEPKR